MTKAPQTRQSLARFLFRGGRAKRSPRARRTRDLPTQTDGPTGGGEIGDLDQRRSVSPLVLKKGGSA